MIDDGSSSVLLRLGPWEVWNALKKDLFFDLTASNADPIAFFLVNPTEQQAAQATQAAQAAAAKTKPKKACLHKSPRDPETHYN